MKQTIILKSETDTQALANQLAEMNLTGSVWLSGDLGAGQDHAYPLLATGNGSYRRGKKSDFYPG